MTDLINAAKTGDVAAVESAIENVQISMPKMTKVRQL